MPPGRQVRLGGVQVCEDSSGAAAVPWNACLWPGVEGAAEAVGCLSNCQLGKARLDKAIRTGAARGAINVAGQANFQREPGQQLSWGVLCYGSVILVRAARLNTDNVQCNAATSAWQPVPALLLDTCKSAKAPVGWPKPLSRSCASACGSNAAQQVPLPNTPARPFAPPAASKNAVKACTPARCLQGHPGAAACLLRLATLCCA